MTFNKELHSNFINQRSEYLNAIGNNDNERVVKRMTINTVIVSGFVLMGIALMLKK